MNDDNVDLADVDLVRELGGLVPGPSPATTARILTAVRDAPVASARTGRFRGPRRRLFAGAASLVILAVIGGTTIAVSAKALPGSPLYSTRFAGEHLRLTLAGGVEKERLRLSYARERIAQAGAIGPKGDRGVARTLLADSADYLHDAKGDVNQLGTSEKVDVQTQIQDLGSDDAQTERNIDQGGGPDQTGSHTGENGGDQGSGG